MENVLNLKEINKAHLLKAIVAVSVLACISYFVSIFDSGNIMMILSNAGYSVPKWAADSLTAIGGVYSAQHFLIGLLGVSVPIWLAAAVVGAGSVGL